MSTPQDQFQAAALSLARPGSIKDRLTEAYRNHLAFVDEDELPNELREAFRAFSHTLTRERPLLRGEDAVRATVRKMSSNEATEVAFAVVRMFGAISRCNTGNTRNKPGKAASNVVPLYVAEA
ncbi:MAG: hypothetical protein ACREVV_15225 [Steroidobacteraceae bacterium]